MGEVGRQEQTEKTVKDALKVGFPLDLCGGLKASFLIIARMETLRYSKSHTKSTLQYPNCV